MKRYTASKFSQEKYLLGEGPCVDKRYDRLSIVDIIAGSIICKENGQVNELKLGKAVGAAIPLKDSKEFVAAGADGLYVTDNGEYKLIYRYDEKFLEHFRANDAKCDRLGRVWFGMIADGDMFGKLKGEVLCYDRGQVKMMVDGTIVANGMAWSADGGTYYLSDSNQHAVFAFDYDIDSNELSNKRVLCQVHDDVPDGLCIDSEDRIWVAVWGGRRVECHDGKSGELLAIVDVDANNVTSCCFDGVSNRLIITTSANEQSGENDGCIFYCDVDANGVDNDYAVL